LVLARGQARGQPRLFQAQLGIPQLEVLINVVHQRQQCALHGPIEAEGAGPTHVQIPLLPDARPRHARPMSLLPFGALPPHVPRRLVPRTVRLSDWPSIAPLFDQLEDRAREARDQADLERWLVDWGELSAALDEESSRRYIAMTCHTDDPAAKQAYLDFLEQVEPQFKPRQFKLSQIFLAHPARERLPKARYE